MFEKQISPNPVHFMLRLQSRVIETYPSLPWRDQAFRSNLGQAHGIVDAWFQPNLFHTSVVWSSFKRVALRISNTFPQHLKVLKTLQYTISYILVHKIFTSRRANLFVMLIVMHKPNFLGNIRRIPLPPVEVWRVIWSHYKCNRPADR